MTPQNLFVAVVGLCLMNGLVSPALPVMMALHPVWLPEMLPPTNEIVFYGASLMVSTGTLLLAGLPAAILERLGAPLTQAMMAWAGGAGVLLLLGLA
ncbi:hypothetical protein G3576_15555 [Roseomonas stagni]|uniref:Uncharacterized protein n=1 Tax=Falsiroseomonas algicola TaxID=2716930 RepID=A0A6M1LN41_9PROT|nr:hypothetical protein [Falsiroseomonas algicola]NGM21439.1 hypothetical protein [Falsiroseomonas algicola]